MARDEHKYEVVPFSRLRRQMLDWLDLMHRRHTIHGLVEVDVTSTRQHIREYRGGAGEPLSLTAFITGCLAQAIDENKHMHAYQKGRNRLILFNEVDVTIAIEREVGGQRIPVPYIIRAANRKGIREIHQEIMAARVEQARESRAARWLPLWLVLPAFIRRFIWARLLSDPRRRKRMTGTVIVTAVGMFGRGTGWGIPLTDYTLCLTLGGIARKPGVVDNQIQIREYLCMTISMDHDVVDGAPAARFTERLKELIETGAGLLDQHGGGAASAPAQPTG